MKIQIEIFSKGIIFLKINKNGQRITKNKAIKIDVSGFFLKNKIKKIHKMLKINIGKL